MVSRIMALLLLLPTSPLLFACAVAIWIDSPGSPFFCQKRVGKHGRYFTIYKLRTMRSGTPDLASSLVGENDTRFTKLGKFLRRYSIDELPQLVNVLKGDMNFVGPRPALYNQYELNEMRERAGVHEIKPGITGWAQVNGRDTISDEKKVELDAFYVKNQSWQLDMKIVLMTLGKSMIGSDLYKTDKIKESDNRG